MIAPTRSGKGVGSIIPTCLNFPGSMIIFDPKGELFFTTAGFRQKFSRILKFSPISRDTVCFNPMAEVELTEQAFADIGLILGNMFEEPKGGNDGAANFFDNMAQDLLTGLIVHVLSSGIYPKKQQTLHGVLGILSQAAAKNTPSGGLCPATPRRGDQSPTVNKLRNKDSGDLFPLLPPSQQFDLWL
jgi:type IV secretion system protein VirD4